MPSTDSVRRRLQDLNLPYRPQREWIEGRGLLVVIAHFFSGLGAGLWLFSLVLDYEPGLVISILVTAVLAGGTHLAFLGRWQRFWRMILRPQSSWISRGLWGISVFVVSGALYLLPGVRDTAFGSAMLVVSLLGMSLVLAYKGFVYFASKAIPFWHIPLLPFLYVAYALRGGGAVLLVAAAAPGEALDIDLLEVIKLWVAVSTGVLVLMYLVLASNAGPAAQRSLRELVAGRISPAFYAGAIFFGLLIPIALEAVGAISGLWRGLLAFVGLSSLAGDFYIKYCVVKAGIYLPLGAEMPRARRYHPLFE